MNRRRLVPALTLALPLLSLFTGCDVVSETGRYRIPLLFSESQMHKMAVDAYAEETGKYKTITGTKAARMVQEVGKKIAKACGKDYAWEFRLLDAPKVVNAFALPGGKIAVYSGLLEITEDEDGLATVIGHEVAHATARHGAERMTDATVAKLGLGAVSAVLTKWDSGDDDTKGLVLKGLGLASTAGLQKFSRTHESEADEIGLEYMMRAGFDPEAAPRLWQRMARLSGGKAAGLLDSFFASHPPSLERAEALRQLIPKLRKKIADQKPGSTPKR
jgi:metalloendopeptidase OMA1, mitochondrial